MPDFQSERPENTSSENKKEDFRKLVVFGYVSSLLCWTLASVSFLQRLLATKQFFFFQDSTGGLQFADFMQFYIAGVLGRQCLFSWQNSLYSPESQLHLFQTLVAPNCKELPFFLQYPPQFFLLNSWMSLFTYETAWFIWTALLVIMAVISAVLLVKSQAEFKANDQNSTRVAIYTSIYFISSYVFFAGVRNGQTAGWLLLGWTIFWLALKQRRLLLAAAATVIGIVKLQYLPYILIAGVIVGGKKYILAVAAIALALLAVDTAAYGPQNINGFCHAIFAGENAIATSSFLMENYKAVAVLVTKQLHSPIVTGVTAAFFIVGCLLVFYLWKFCQEKLQTKTAFSFEICAALTTLISLTTSIHTHEHDYLIAGLSGFYLWLWLRNKKSWLASAILYATYSLPIWSWVCYGLDPITPYAWIAKPLLIWATFVICASFYLIKQNIKQ